MVSDLGRPFSYTAEVSFPDAEKAEIVCRALDVDPELRPEFVARELSVEGNRLIMNFEARDMRTLRAAVGTFCDLLVLSSRTVETFALE